MAHRLASGWVAILALGLLSPWLTATEAPLLRVDFESHPTGTYVRPMAERDWGTLAWISLHDRGEIVLDHQTSSKVLRMFYPAGSVGPAEGGGQFLVTLPPSDELWLSYRLRFGEGFDFNRGGKLPGLTAGGSRYTGGVIPREGDGWSARYMWARGGKINVYAYYVDMPGPWGQTLSLDRAATAVPNRWHTIAQYVRVNTPGKADGVLEVWFDGKKVFSREDLRWRTGERGRIDSVYFSTFHGGNTRDWAPSVDCHCDFDDIVISRSKPKME